MLKNITLSAEEELIKAARAKAQAESTTLNNMFRKWIAEYTESQKQRDVRVKKYRALVKKLGYVKIDRKFTREEMNARR